MTDWQPIETANRPAKNVALAIIVNDRIEREDIGHWHEGDLDAGWATVMGRPLGFEPTHWIALPK